MGWIVGSACQNISANRGGFRGLFKARPANPARTVDAVNPTLPSLIPSRPVRGLAPMAVALLACVGMTGAAAQTAETPSLAEPLAAQVRQLILERVVGPASPRAEVVLGRLDPRLRLAACRKVDAYIPTGTRLWGASRVGLRCVEGPAAWNVYLPVTVRVFGPGWVAASPLPAGHVLSQTDVRPAEINLSEHRSPAIADGPSIVGRALAQPLSAGQAVRETSLKSRQWFGPGETVQVRAVGGGFAIVGTGEALGAGLEGQSVRVRTDNGKVVSGLPVGDRIVEITL